MTIDKHDFGKKEIEILLPESIATAFSFKSLPNFAFGRDGSFTRASSL
ncbi:MULTISPECIES: hypothetical protein [unclassified Bradyrhizobium]|nr:MULTISPECIES: hypothetical protein [unclassified Bradyrhizobium]